MDNGNIGEVRDCEMFKVGGVGRCKKEGFKNHQMAPGTIVPLCRECYQEVTGEIIATEEE